MLSCLTPYCPFLSTGIRRFCNAFYELEPYSYQEIGLWIGSLVYWLRSGAFQTPTYCTIFLGHLFGFTEELIR